MKKVFIAVSVITVMALSSCSQQEPFEDQKPLGFSTFIGKSRASILDTDGLKDKGFIVQAYQTDASPWASSTLTDPNPNFMKGTEVTWTSDDGGKWVYEHTKYWPANDGQLTFFAYGASDQGDVPELTFTGQTPPTAPKFDFKVEDAVEDQVDLVADALFDQKYSTSGGGKVKFEFDHILSKIGFSAKTAANYSSTNTTITVTDLKLTFANEAIQTNGTFTFDDGTGTEVGEWNLASSGKTYIPDTAEQDLLGSEVNLKHDEYKFINDDTNYLMLLPQDLAAGTLTAQIAYKVTDADGSTTYTTPAISLPAATVKLELGKGYTFNFLFTLRQVIFEGIEVNKWPDEDTQSDDLDVE
jgi:hypothetical protein